MRILPTLALLALLPLAACQKPADPAASAGHDDGLIARSVRQAIDSAKDELAKSNVTVGGLGLGEMQVNGVKLGGYIKRSSHLPKAEISPSGDLLIDGKAVAIEPAQRELLLAHRTNVLAIAEAGMEIGLQGASLGTQAASGALASVLTGNSEAFEKKMEAEAKKIEFEALKLCERLPPLLQSQQALAAALPAFQPYATLEKGDLDSCNAERERQTQAQTQS